MKPTLVIMAAGLGSRYGGLKQIEPVGPNGEMIMDYSIYDALRAGFGKVVFIIKKDNLHEFRRRIGLKMETIMDAAYVFQDINNVPEWFTVPTERVKPWGTGHAVLCCKNAVKGPFAVINADDFYGRESFLQLAEELTGRKAEEGVQRFCMVGFRLINTVSKHGSVARGVCGVGDDGYLQNIVERTRVERNGVGVRFTEDGHNWTPIPDDSIVSMNAWGFTTGIFRELEARFHMFLKNNMEDPNNILGAEFFLPDVINTLLSEQKARVRVLPTTDHWFGVTYKEDRDGVSRAIARLIDNGVYPSRLWGD